jgi:hypothetical protein
LSAGAEVITRALKLDLGRMAELRVPGRALTAAAAGQWVVEGQAARVRQLNFANAAMWQPRKLEVISVASREMVESSNIEAILQQTLQEATGLALDLAMFSSAAGNGQPPGLFAGVAPITPTAGGGSGAMMTDFGNLFSALASHGAGKTAVIVAAMPQAIALKLTAGPKFDIDIIASTALATGTVAVLEVASFVSAFSDVVEFSTTKTGALHMEDTSPTHITGGTPSPAVPVKSIYQIDALALKSTLWASWGLRATGHCQFLTGATW